MFHVKHLPRPISSPRMDPIVELIYSIPFLIAAVAVIATVTTLIGVEVGARIRRWLNRR